ncbi:ABC transporter permease [Dietzia aerolata]|uniref:ABC transporter permease n=1 Tax=Dietzia aerolata TaxID=595984 RepID=UPI0036415A06
MLRVSLRNIAAHKVRLLLSVLAVVLGTAFVTGSLVFTSTLKNTFDGLLEQGTADLSVQIEPADPRGAGVPFGVAEEVLEVPGVAAAVPGVSGTVVVFNADGTPYQSGGAPSEGIAWIEPERAVGSSNELVDGRAPAADGEVVLPAGVLEGRVSRSATPRRSTPPPTACWM